MLAAAAAAGLTVAAVAPARAATGLPTPPPVPSSLAALPTLLPTTPTPTPAPPSAVCSAPVISAVSYTWTAPANPAEAAWAQPNGPDGKPDQQVAEWNADTGYVTVTGTNLVQQGCVAAVSIGGAALGSSFDATRTSQPGAAAPQTIVIDFTPATRLPAQPATAAQPVSATNPTGTPAAPPSIAAGVVRVSETDPTGAEQDSSKNPHHYVIVQQPPGPDALSSATPKEGDPETVSGGGGFSQFEAGQPGAAPGAWLQTSFAGCEGQTVPSGYVPAPDTQKQPLDLSIVTDVPYAYCNGPLGMRFGFAPDASQPSYCNAPPPPGAAANCESFGETAGNVDVAFDLTSLAPNPVAPGGSILVEGSGFGTAGAARVGGTALTVCAGCWSDRFVILKAPADPVSGYLFLRRTEAGGDGAEVQWPQQVVVRHGAPAGPGNCYGGIPIGYLLPGGALQFVPGHLGGAPHSLPSSSSDVLNLTVSKNKADTGSDVSFTVTISVQGTPVAAAPVTLTVVSSPGGDTKLSPSSGSTNSRGKLSGTLHLSASPGTTLLLARSGTHSDEVTVLGQKPAAAGLFGGKLPFGLNVDLSGNPLVVWLSVATVLLILIGVAVNLDVLRRFLWSISFGRLMRRLRARHTAAA